MSFSRNHPTGATAPSLRSLDTPGAFTVGYALLAPALMDGLGSGLFPLAGAVLLLLPAIALSKRQLPPHYGHAWNIASAVFILVMLFSHVFLGRPSHVALALICVFLLLHRWFNPRGLREHLESWCLTALLMMIAALKGEGTILILLQLGWFFSTLQLFNLMAVLRANDRRELPDPYTAAPRSLKTLPLQVPVIFALAIAILFLAPRLKPHGAPDGRSRVGLTVSERVTVQAGFSDTVNFDSMTNIQQTDAIALRIVDPPPQANPANLRLRVSTLDEFDGWEWRRTEHPERVLVAEAGLIRLGDRSNLHEENQDLHWYQVQLQEFPTNLLPIPDRAILMGGMPGDVAISLGADGRAIVRQSRPPRSYYAWAFPARVPGSRPLMSGDVEPAHIAIPSVLEVSTRSLAEKIWRETAITSEEEKAHHAANWMRRNGTYTLDLTGLPPGPAALRAFMGSLEGHCELHATALALVLRNEGIPARLVTGFSGAEPTFSTFGPNREWVVPHRNAHAWVEAWTGSTGWFALDPTPPALYSQTPNVTAVSDFNQYMSAEGSVLSRLVEGYDYEAQRRAVRRSKEELYNAAASVEQGMLIRTWERFRRNFSELPIQATTLALLLFNLGASLCYRHYRNGRWQRPSNELPKEREGVSALFHEVLKKLKTAPPQGGTTAAEWLREAIQGASWEAEDKARFIDLYTRWRFGGMNETDESELRALVKRMKK